MCLYTHIHTHTHTHIYILCIYTYSTFIHKCTRRVVVTSKREKMPWNDCGERRRDLSTVYNVSFFKIKSLKKMWQMLSVVNPRSCMYDIYFFFISKYKV